MRVLVSTYEPVTPDLDEEEREALAALARAGAAIRTSYALNHYGQDGVRITLRQYCTPEGEERWAVVYEGPESTEVTDSVGRAEADAAYEDEVRGMVEYGGDAPAWTESDVPGVPNAAYRVVVERQIEGAWDREEVASHLGQTLRVGAHEVDGDEVTDLTKAAGVIARTLAAAQRGDNYDALLSEAVGEPTLTDVVGVFRVTVTGVGEDGEATFTASHAVPEERPTAQQIEDYRRRLTQIEEDREREFAGHSEETGWL
ncbi:hypothetical protein ACF09E_34555 [Streptomyces sp. NPDC014891]|uniref:hypothetical protein n=1 Tax=Streptomyces sp. NPDC014891 TaxID=3364929 RepID=UPI0036FB7D99